MWWLLSSLRLGKHNVSEEERGGQGGDCKLTISMRLRVQIQCTLTCDFPEQMRQNDGVGRNHMRRRSTGAWSRVCREDVGGGSGTGVVVNDEGLSDLRGGIYTPPWPLRTLARLAHTSRKARRVA